MRWLLKSIVDGRVAVGRRRVVYRAAEGSPKTFSANSSSFDNNNNNNIACIIIHV